jgi:predicted TIM-barrel fold metal-dependent hydrolase
MTHPTIFPHPLLVGAVDCHAHILGPFDQYPLDSRRKFTPTVALVPAYCTMLESLGVSRAVIVQASVYGADNRCTVDAIRDLNARGVAARGVGLVLPGTPRDELQAMYRNGIRGLRLNHLFPGPINGKTIAPYVEMAHKYGFHLQLFQPPAALLSVLPILVDAGVTWVVDHLGMIPAAQGTSSPEFALLCDALQCGRGWVKLSGFYRISQAAAYADVQPMVQALYAAAPTRCVWGTDWPHTDVIRLPDTAQLLDRLLVWLPDDHARQRVLIDNPAELYNFGSSLISL